MTIEPLVRFKHKSADGTTSDTWEKEFLVTSILDFAALLHIGSPSAMNELNALINAIASFHKISDYAVDMRLNKRAVKIIVHINTTQSPPGSLLVYEVYDLGDRALEREEKAKKLEEMSSEAYVEVVYDLKDDVDVRDETDDMMEKFEESVGFWKGWTSTN